MREAWDGGRVTLGSLPLALFLNGHGYFVQRADLRLKDLRPPHRPPAPPLAPTPAPWTAGVPLCGARNLLARQHCEWHSCEQCSCE